MGIYKHFIKRQTGFDTTYLVKAASLKSLLIASVFYGIGFGSVQPILNALIVSLAPPQRRGADNATFLAAMDLGMGIGALAWGAVSQRFGYVYIYSVSIVLALLAGIAYFILSKSEKSQRIEDLQSRIDKTMENLYL